MNRTYLILWIWDQSLYGNLLFRRFEHPKSSRYEPSPPLNDPTFHLARSSYAGSTQVQKVRARVGRRHGKWKRVRMISLNKHIIQYIEIWFLICFCIYILLFSLNPHEWVENWDHQDPTSNILKRPAEKPRAIRPQVFSQWRIFFQVMMHTLVQRNKLRITSPRSASYHEKKGSGWVGFFQRNLAGTMSFNKEFTQ